MSSICTWICVLLLLAVRALGQAGPPPAPAEGSKTAPPEETVQAPVSPPAPQAHPPPGQGSASAMREALAKQKAAMAVQKSAVRQQAETVGVWLMPFDDFQFVDTPCEPIADALVKPVIENAGKAQKVETGLLRAVIDQESGFHPCAVSSRGAKGLMQLMPEVADQYSVRDPFDPRQNVEAGAAYLKQLLDRYHGDLQLALAAYNAGPRRVDESGGVPDIPQTRNYVESILEKLKSRDPDPPPDPKPKPPAK